MDEKEKNEKLLEHIRNLAALVKEYQVKEQELVRTLIENTNAMKKCLNKIYGHQTGEF